MNPKEITVVFYGRSWGRTDWRCEVDEVGLAGLIAAMKTEFRRFGIEVQSQRDESVVIEVNGYGDLLNSIRLRSPQDGIGNLCLGHIVGASANRNLLEDLRRGVSRIAFAPETIAPEEHDRRICHNCGCGC